MMTHVRLFLAALLVLTLLVLVACTGAAGPAGDGAAAEQAAGEPVGGETAAGVPPVDVPAMTPSQQEGPFYPLEKPADRDNDLVALEGAPGTPVGQVLEFGGTVYDAGGNPLPDVTIEIWQTDDSGVYDHPNDPGYANRDTNFQFYGEATTGPDGTYQFRTIVPGEYEPRPRHIHVKFFRNGEELLTTQFYFADEVQLRGADALLVIDARPGAGESGNPVLTGTRDVFLNVRPAG